MLRPLAVDDRPRPLVQGSNSLTRRVSNAGIPTAALCAGFTLSATLIFAIATFVGAALGATLVPQEGRHVAAAFCCVALLVLDIVALRRHSFCPIGFRRQTPKNLVLRYGDTRGALIWGFDTGLAITTFRVSAATWALLFLGLLGVAPWWQGFVYAAGFCLPIAMSILLVPRRTDHPDGSPREPHWISRLLNRYRWVAQVGVLLAALTAGVVTVAGLGL